MPALAAPPAPEAPKPPAAADDDVQEVSVVDLLPAEPPPLAARQAMPTLPDPALAAPEPAAAAVECVTEPPVTTPAPEVAPFQPYELTAPSAPIADVVAVVQPARAPEPAASPYARSVAYGPDSDLTPRAFGFQDPPAATDGVRLPPHTAPRGRVWPTRVAIAAVALFGVAAASVGVVQSGVVARTPARVTAAPQAVAKLSVPRPVVPAAPASPTPAPAHTATPEPSPAPSAASEAIAPAPAVAPAETAALPASTAPAATDPARRLPAYVNEPGVLFLTRVAVQRAERTCHRRGRAVGKAQVFATFMPNGHVSQARVEGEPIESAPVSRCIKDQLYAVIIPKFDGAPFTVSEPITLY